MSRNPVYPKMFIKKRIVGYSALHGPIYSDCLVIPRNHVAYSAEKGDITALNHYGLAENFLKNTPNQEEESNRKQGDKYVAE